MDESWLDQNPPQTFGAGDWTGSGWNSVVDSELIMLFIMKQIEIYGEVISWSRVCIFLNDRGRHKSLYA